MSVIFRPDPNQDPDLDPFFFRQLDPDPSNIVPDPQHYFLRRGDRFSDSLYFFCTISIFRMI